MEFNNIKSILFTLDSYVKEELKLLDLHIKSIENSTDDRLEKILPKLYNFFLLYKLSNVLYEL